MVLCDRDGDKSNSTDCLRFLWKCQTPPRSSRSPCTPNMCRSVSNAAGLCADDVTMFFLHTLCPTLQLPASAKTWCRIYLFMWRRFSSFGLSSQLAYTTRGRLKQFASILLFFCLNSLRVEFLNQVLSHGSSRFLGIQKRRRRLLWVGCFICSTEGVMLNLYILYKRAKLVYLIQYNELRGSYMFEPSSTGIMTCTLSTARDNCISVDRRLPSPCVQSSGF